MTSSSVAAALTGQPESCTPADAQPGTSGLSVADTSPDVSWADLPERVPLGTIGCHPLQQDNAISMIVEAAATGQRGYVVTPNVDFVCVAEKDSTFRRYVNEASLSLVDGMPLVWLANASGQPVPERVAGSDMLLPLLRAASDQGLRVALLGALPETMVRAVAVIERECPGIQIVHRSSPWFERGRVTAERSAAIDALLADRPQLVVLALDSVKQIELQRELVRRAMPTVSIGLGAALQFLVGERERAPRWMQRFGLEWVHRLASDPRHLAHRYLVRDAIIVRIALRQIKSEQLARARRRHPTGAHR
jgi:N-acetylglucosaminyldiphosphoundecaprenol N-acetyl-beta-D-mannosaminyltransferase